MDEYFKTLEDRLHQIFFDNDNITEQELYNKVFINKPKNGFNSKYEDLLVELITFLYCKYNDINKIVELPVDLYQGESFSDFKATMDELKVTPYYNIIKSAVLEKVLKSNNSTRTITSKTIKEEKDVEDKYKLYIPVDNASLHLFTTLMIVRCESMGISYNIKINNNDFEQLGNNVTIYANEDNYLDYIYVINSILIEHPNIIVDRDALPIISYPLSADIGVEPIDNDTFGSDYDKFLCNRIIEFKNITRNYTEFLEFLEDMLSIDYKGVLKDYEIEEKNTNKLL